jgi:CDP-diacylglycerol--serine O-phosphatidyltransferase
LDSLADVISFGVAPAAIAFAAGLNNGVEQVILIFFAACGLSRLARYNVTAEQMASNTGKVEYFEGTPIPTSIVPLGVLLFLFHFDQLQRTSLLGLVDLHRVAVLFFISGCLMISKTLRIPKP